MVAVYPCAPMAFWHQYQVLVKGGDAKVCALSDGQWQGVENRENWTALLTAQYPSCLTLEKDGESLGALPNILDKERTRAEISLQLRPLTSVRRSQR